MSQPVGIVQIPLAPQGQVMNPSFGQLANLVTGPLGLVSWANSLTNWLSQFTQNIQTSLNTQVQGAGPDIVAATTVAISNFEHNVTGTGTIQTINPPPGFNGFLILKSVNGFSFGSSGNILASGNIPKNDAVLLLWDAVDQAWFVIAVTAVQIMAGTGVSVTQSGNQAIISNTGITSIQAGAGIAVSSSSGNAMVTSMAVSRVAMKGDGTVFNAIVPGSPITSSGTLAPVLISQSANTALMGPSAGSGNPTFRVIAGADLPTPTASTLGGIESLAAVAHKWINQISTAGVPSATQPATSDLSDYVTGAITFTDQSGAGLSFAAGTIGHYAQIGSVIHVWGSVVYPSTADTSHAAIGWTAPPANSANQNYSAFPFPVKVSGFADGIGVFVKNNTQFAMETSTGGANITNANCSGATVSFGFAYSTT